MTTAGSATPASAPGFTMAVPPGLLAFAERELNRLGAESTAAAELLERLQGSSFAIHVEGLGVTAVLQADGERVRVHTDPVGATATLRATPLDLLRLMNAEGVTDVKRTRANLSGDLQIAERFSQFLKLARPDLEDEVARWIGDVPAHALGEAVRDAGAWFKRAAEALRLNTAEYLQEESQALPGPLEAQAFYSDVERLRDDVERAAARLARLERR
jgi:ubiquinone biosynthesis protein UbiJ